MSIGDSEWLLELLGCCTCTRLFSFTIWVVAFRVIVVCKSPPLSECNRFNVFRWFGTKPTSASAVYGGYAVSAYTYSGVLHLGMSTQKVGPILHEIALMSSAKGSMRKTKFDLAAGKTAALTVLHKPYQACESACWWKRRKPASQNHYICKTLSTLMVESRTHARCLHSTATWLFSAQRFAKIRTAVTST